MGTSLKRWGFTPQKPVKRACQRNDPQVLEQLNQECPSIKAPAKEEAKEEAKADEADAPEAKSDEKKEEKEEKKDDKKDDKA